jgi:hypothetical protein
MHSGEGKSAGGSGLNAGWVVRAVPGRIDAQGYKFPRCDLRRVSSGLVVIESAPLPLTMVLASKQVVGRISVRMKSPSAVGGSKLALAGAGGVIGNGLRPRLRRAASRPRLIKRPGKGRKSC